MREAQKKPMNISRLAGILLYALIIFTIGAINFSQTSSFKYTNPIYFAAALTPSIIFTLSFAAITAFILVKVDRQVTVSHNRIGFWVYLLVMYVLAQLFLYTGTYRDEKEYGHSINVDDKNLQLATNNSIKKSSGELFDKFKSECIAHIESSEKFCKCAFEEIYTNAKANELQKYVELYSMSGELPSILVQTIENPDPDGICGKIRIQDKGWNHFKELSTQEGQ